MQKIDPFYFIVEKVGVRCYSLLCYYPITFNYIIMLTFFLYSYQQCGWAYNFLPHKKTYLHGCRQLGTRFYLLSDVKVQYYVYTFIGTTFTCMHVSKLSTSQEETHSQLKNILLGINWRFQKISPGLVLTIMGNIESTLQIIYMNMSKSQVTKINSIIFSKKKKKKMNSIISVTLLFLSYLYPHIESLPLQG